MGENASQTGSKCIANRDAIPDILVPGKQYIFLPFNDVNTEVLSSNFSTEKEFQLLILNQRTKWLIEWLPNLFFTWAVYSDLWLLVSCLAKHTQHRQPSCGSESPHQVSPETAFCSPGSGHPKDGELLSQCDNNCKAERKENKWIISKPGLGKIIIFSHEANSVRKKQITITYTAINFNDSLRKASACNFTTGVTCSLPLHYDLCWKLTWYNLPFTTTLWHAGSWNGVTCPLPLHYDLCCRKARSMGPSITWWKNLISRNVCFLWDLYVCIN